MVGGDRRSGLRLGGRVDLEEAPRDRCGVERGEAPGLERRRDGLGRGARAAGVDRAAPRAGARRRLRPVHHDRPAERAHQPDRHRSDDERRISARRRPPAPRSRRPARRGRRGSARPPGPTRAPATPARMISTTCPGTARSRERPTPARIAVREQPSTIDSMPSASHAAQADRLVAEPQPHEQVPAPPAGRSRTRARRCRRPASRRPGRRPSRSRPPRAARAGPRPAARRRAGPAPSPTGRGSRPAGCAGAGRRRAGAAGRGADRRPRARRYAGRQRRQGGLRRAVPADPHQVVDDHPGDQHAADQPRQHPRDGRPRGRLGRHARTSITGYPEPLGGVGPSTAARRRAARPRWEIAAFSSRVISAIERSVPSGRNTGS